MTRNRLLCIELSIIFLLLLAGCGRQKFVFPEKEDFEIQFEIISVSEYDEENYQLQINAALKNNSEQSLLLYSGTCLLDLTVNGKYVQPQKDAVAVPYTLESFSAHTEAITVQIPKAEFIGSQLQTVSHFRIEDKSDAQQNYVVKSEVYTLTEEDL